MMPGNIPSTERTASSVPSAALGAGKASIPREHHHSRWARMPHTMTALVRLALVISSLLIGAGASAAQQPSVNRQLQQQWAVRVVAHLGRLARHPDSYLASCDAPREAFPRIRFTIDRSGRVLEAHLVKSSGIRAMDRAAIDIVKQASPVPSPPTGVGGTKLLLELPVAFRRGCSDRLRSG